MLQHLREKERNISKKVKNNTNLGRFIMLKVFCCIIATSCIRAKIKISMKTTKIDIIVA